MLWRRYRAKRGTFHLGMRVDRVGSRILATLLNVHARKNVHSVTDFSPYEDRVEPEEGSVEQAFAMLSALAEAGAVAQS